VKRSLAEINPRTGAALRIDHIRCRPYPFRIMRWLVVISMLWTALPAVAQSEASLEPRVRDFLNQYVNAWQSANPFHLVDLSARRSHPFDELLDQEHFDRLQQSAVRVHDVRIVEQSDDGQRLVVTFTKDHEDLYLDGTLTRGLAHVQVVLKAQDEFVRTEGTGDLGVVSHKVLRAHYDEMDQRFTHSDAEKHVFAALAYLRNSRFAAALKRLNQAVVSADSVQIQLGKDRFNAQVQYYRAVCFQRQEDTAASVNALQSALKLNSEFPLALNALARHHVREGRLREALPLFRRSLDLHPRQEGVAEEVDFLRRALTHMQSEESRKVYLSLRGLSPLRALELARRQRQADPNNDEWRRMTAVLLIENHQPSRAEQLLLKVSKVMVSSDLLYVLARATLAQGKTSLALERFHALWKRAPDYRDSIVYLTELSSQSNRWRSAMAYLDEALQRRPGTPDLLFKRGVYELRLGRRFQALTTFQQAREQRPMRHIRRALHTLMQQI
jgi:tetratricopeptide (TPR) repeat protein